MDTSSRSSDHTSTSSLLSSTSSPATIAAAPANYGSHQRVRHGGWVVDDGITSYSLSTKESAPTAAAVAAAIGNKVVDASSSSSSSNNKDNLMAAHTAAASTLIQTLIGQNTDTKNDSSDTTALAPNSNSEGSDDAHAIDDVDLTDEQITPRCVNWAIWRKEYVALLNLALPVIGTFACTIALGLSNILFIGHIGADELAGSALGVMFCNVTGYSVGLGLLAAMDTLGAQAYGAKNYRRVGILLQRTMFILAIAMIPIMSLWATSEQILLFAGQSPETAHLAGRYTRVSIIGLPGAFLFESFRRYLECQSIVRPTLIVSLIGVSVNIVMPAVLIYGLGFGFDAAAPSIVTANWCQAIGLYTWMRVKKLHQQTWPGWSREAFQEIKPYMALGLPGMAMLCAEWWGFEIHALLAGLKGTVALGAQSLILNTAQLAFMVPLGMGVAASTRVGNALGAGLANRGAMSSRAAISAIAVVLTLEAVFFLCIRHVWGYIFSNDEDIVKMVSSTMPIFIGFIFFDGTQGVCSGVLRGAGKQKIGAVANLAGYWAFALPAAWALAFPADLGVRGQWIAISVASLAICALFLSVIYRMNWPLVARTAFERELKHKMDKEQALLADGGDGDQGDITGTASDGHTTTNNKNTRSHDWLADCVAPLPFAVETAFAFDAHTHDHHSHPMAAYDHDTALPRYQPSNVVVAVHSCHLSSWP